jgi:hypothetical protein
MVVALSPEVVVLAVAMMRPPASRVFSSPPADLWVLPSSLPFASRIVVVEDFPDFVVLEVAMTRPLPSRAVTVFVKLVDRRTTLPLASRSVACV